MANLYVGVKVIAPMFLREYVRMNNIPQCDEDRQLLHSTVLHSKNYVHDVPEQSTIHIARPAGFVSLPYGERKVLALKIECASLARRNAELRKAGLIDRWEIFNPHITLSYDLGDFDFTQLPPITQNIILGQESVRKGGKRLFHCDKAWTRIQKHLKKFMEGQDDRCVLA